MSYLQDGTVLRNPSEVQINNIPEPDKILDLEDKIGDCLTEAKCLVTFHKIVSKVMHFKSGSEVAIQYLQKVISNLDRLLYI